MASAPTETATAPTVADAPRDSWLKANAGLFAVAFAIMFGAGVWGYVTSPAFATLVTGFGLFALILGASAAIAASSGWVGMAIAWVVSLVAYAVLFGAIDDARQISAASPAKVAAPAS